MTRLPHRIAVAASATLAAAALVVSGVVPASARPPAETAGAGESSPRLDAATPGTLQEWTSLIGFSYPNTVVTSASIVAAGVLSNRGQPIGEHCLVTGKNERAGEHRR